MQLAAFCGAHLSRLRERKPSQECARFVNTQVSATLNVFKACVSEANLNLSAQSLFYELAEEGDCTVL